MHGTFYAAVSLLSPGAIVSINFGHDKFCYDQHSYDGEQLATILLQDPKFGAAPSSPPNYDLEAFDMLAHIDEASVAPSSNVLISNVCIGMRVCYRNPAVVGAPSAEAVVLGVRHWAQTLLLGRRDIHSGKYKIEWCTAACVLSTNHKPIPDVSRVIDEVFEWIAVQLASLEPSQLRAAIQIIEAQNRRLNITLCQAYAQTLILQLSSSTGSSFLLELHNICGDLAVQSVLNSIALDPSLSSRPNFFQQHGYLCYNAMPFPTAHFLPAMVSLRC